MWTNTPTVYMFFINGVTPLEIEIYTCESELDNPQVLAVVPN